MSRCELYLANGCPVFAGELLESAGGTIEDGAFACGVAVGITPDDQIDGAGGRFARASVCLGGDEEELAVVAGQEMEGHGLATVFEDAGCLVEGRDSAAAGAKVCRGLQVVPVADDLARLDGCIGAGSGGGFGPSAGGQAEGGK